MHLLITNDDGFDSVGIQTLAQVCKNAGHDVLIVAPATQQSATSQCLSISKPLMSKPFTINGINGFAIEGSPVDCVRVAQHLTDKKFDFCLAGINDGLNAGAAIYYSGTDGAAREASMNYMQSLALSIDRHATEDMLTNLAKIAVSKLDYLSKNPMPRMCFLNINAPAIAIDKIKGEKLAVISPAFFIDGYEKRLSPFGRDYFWMRADSSFEESPEGSDLYYLDRGYISYTFVGGFMDHNNTNKNII
ncbi:MAG: 5'/3'-nucleotidase SurE [Eubacteriales bacterium]|nr:5'/3'-nucleotidase SurE [Eubacteriales bacterium]